ncbi:MAG: hypothetical protein ACK55I_20950, partial [bacterium]
LQQVVGHHGEGDRALHAAELVAQEAVVGQDAPHGQQREALDELAARVERADGAGAHVLVHDHAQVLHGLVVLVQPLERGVPEPELGQGGEVRAHVEEAVEGHVAREVVGGLQGGLVRREALRLLAALQT